MANSFVLFDRPLASFTNNIIYIDRPNNHKKKLEVVCKIFLFKITFSTHHITIWRLCRFHLSYRGKNDKKVVSSTRFTSFPASFFFCKPTQAHTSGFSHQTKIYRTCADKMRLYSLEVHVRFNCHFLILQKRRAEERKKLVLREWAMVKKKENGGVGQLIIPFPSPHSLHL